MNTCSFPVPFLFFSDIAIAVRIIFSHQPGGIAGVAGTQRINPGQIMRPDPILPDGLAVFSE